MAWPVLVMVEKTKRVSGKRRLRAWASGWTLSVSPTEHEWIQMVGRPSGLSVSGRLPSRSRSAGRYFWCRHAFHKKNGVISTIHTPKTRL